MVGAGERSDEGRELETLSNHGQSLETISNRVLAVFQFRVVALTDSAFSTALLESLVLPYPPGQYR